MTKCTTCIFDFDGTIVDTQQDVVESFAQDFESSFSAANQKASLEVQSPLINLS